MMEGTLIDRARADRKSPATLKVQVSNLRSKDPNEPILVFEGSEDIGPYETWINSIISKHVTNMLPGAGKEQVLEFRGMLRVDKTGLAKNVFFFVDRDYDDLQGHQPGSDLFCCDRYSVENYLVTERVVKSLLRDEFRLQPFSPEFEISLCFFKQALESLNIALRPINQHLYCCRKLGASLNQRTPELKKFAEVKIDKVTLIDTPERLISAHLSTHERMPEEACMQLQSDFSQLNPSCRHRGKFQFEFLRRWIECLLEEALNPTGSVFQTKIKTKISQASLTMRSCASRSEKPINLKEFLGGVYQG